MKVLLINPFVSKRKIYGVLAAFSPALPSLGLSYLASYLLRFEHEVEIMDLNIFPKADIVAFIKEIQPDLIGVTATTVSFTSARDLLKIIKIHYPDTPTVLGGPHISAIPSKP